MARWCQNRMVATVGICLCLTTLFWGLFSTGSYSQTYDSLLNIRKFAFVPESNIEDISVPTSKPEPKAKPTPECVDPFAVKFKNVEDLYCRKIPKFVEGYKNPCFYYYQRSGRVLACLPYFYILGMDKCGTTDLHSRLASHPDVRGNKGSHNKETSYWSWYRYGIFNYGTIERNWTFEDYLNQFENTAKELHRNATLGQRIITGDATPMDLWDFRNWPRIPQNYGKLEPEILTPHLVDYIHKKRIPKFLIQLREPIERLYSDYFFIRQRGSPENFHKAVVNALAIIKSCISSHGRRYCFFNKHIYDKLPTRIHLGCYSVFIKEWFEVFPRSSFHFSRTEDFHKEMKQTLNGIFSFLDLDQMEDDQLSALTARDIKHVTKVKKGSILPETFQLLKDFYAPYIQETAELLKDKKYLWNDVYSKKPQKQQLVQ